MTEASRVRKGERYRHTLESRLVAVPWDQVTPVDSLQLFNNLYVSNATNLNFMHQKILKSHIGSRRVFPAEGALELWASGVSLKYTIFERRRNRKKAGGDEERLCPVAVATICGIDSLNRSAEIKFIILPNQYGRGLTRLVFKKLLEVAFDGLELNTIVVRLLKDARTYPTANAFLKFARKAGVLLDFIEAEGKMRHMYLFQVPLSFWIKSTEKEEYIGEER